MRFLNIVHPPSGASALIAVIGGQSVQELGFGYVVTCTGGGCVCVFVAIVFNNLVPWRQYPLYW
jgi:CBS-domain-containing membrane protein